MSIQRNTSLMLLATNPHHPHYERLTNIEKSVQNGSKLTSQLLGYARGGRYEILPLNINHIIKETSAIVAMTKKDITIHHDLTNNLSGVRADRGQIEQVLLNIYVNATEAMPGGGGLFVTAKNLTHKDIKKKSYTVKPGNYILLTMRDTGIGMDKSTQEKVFDPFFTTKEMGRGTGLGLASVYGIIKNHDGIIDVYSKKGEGATFTIYLPASYKEIIEEKGVPGEVLRGVETVLLVDNEDTIVDIGEKTLNMMRYQVLAARSGEEAVDYLKDNSADLLILDMIMDPGIDGLETYKRIIEFHPGQKAIIASGFSETKRVKKAQKLGAGAYVKKPFLLEKIGVAVRDELHK